MSKDTTNTPAEIDEDIIDDIGAPDNQVSAGPEATPEQLAELREQQTVEFDDTPGTVEVAGVTADSAQETQPADEVPAPTAAVSKSSEPTAPDAEDETQAPDAATPIYEQAFLDAAGISADQAAAQFGTPEALKNAVRMLDQRFVAAGAAALSQQAQRQPAPVAPAPQHQPSGDANAAAQLPAFQMPKPASGEEWDPDTVELANGIAAQFRAQLAAQQQAFEERLRANDSVTQQLLEERIQQERVAYANEFDGFVEKLGEQWKPLLGEGSGFDLPKESIAYQNRVHLDVIASQLKAGLETQGRPSLSRDQLLSRALQIAFPEQQKIAVKKEVAEQLTKRQGLITNRPSAKAPAGKTGLDKASNRAEQWYRDHGFAVEEDVFDYSEI